MNIWLTGLSEAGKSTLAEMSSTEFRRRGYRVEVLKGDEVRTNLSKDLGFSQQDRDAHIRQIGYVCGLLVHKNVIAIAAAISPYREVRGSGSPPASRLFRGLRQPLDRIFRNPVSRLSLVVLAMILLSACAAGAGRSVAAVNVPGENGSMRGGQDFHASDGAVQPALADQTSPQSAILAQLLEERTQTHDIDDFPIGPGDLLRINVPGVPEFKGYEERVTPTGSLELPVIGTVHAAGLTEDGLTETLRRRLAKYIRYPDVQVFVTHFASREVAVVGMVQKPGLYTLNSSSQTLLEIMTEAGGLTNEAASQIYFVPAEGAQSARLSPAAYSVLGKEADSVALASPGAIVVDLARLAGSGFLSLPARPGDVIIVPRAGQVMVQGWVRHPGSFPITPRMTVLAAVGAAGGAMFSSSARLLREQSNGRKSDSPLDLTKIADGDEPDIPVEAGDVVVVNASAAGAVPYLFYTLVSHFNGGLYSGF